MFDCIIGVVVGCILGGVIVNRYHFSSAKLRSERIIFFTDSVSEIEGWAILDNGTCLESWSYKDPERLEKRGMGFSDTQQGSERIEVRAGTIRHMIVAHSGNATKRVY